MPVSQLSIDAVRERLPRLVQQARDRLAGVALQRPGWPIGRADHWLSWRSVAAAVFLGGVVHILATFATPLYSTGHAYQRLAETLPPNRMVVLPQQAPGRQILPGLPPDMLYAMCRYDLSNGPVAVAATVPGPGSALSLHTPQESNFYVLPGQPRRRTDVSFVVVPSGPYTVPLARRESADDTEVASPTIEGVIVLRIPIRGLAWTARAQAVLKSATCGPARR